MAYPVLKAPIQDGVWGREFLESLTLSFCAKGVWFQPRMSKAQVEIVPVLQARLLEGGITTNQLFSSWVRNYHFFLDPLWPTMLKGWTHIWVLFNYISIQSFSTIFPLVLHKIWSSSFSNSNWIKVFSPVFFSHFSCVHVLTLSFVLLVCSFLLS